MMEVVLGSLLIVLLIMALAAGLLAARSQLVPDTVLEVTVNARQTLKSKRGQKLLDVCTGPAFPFPQRAAAAARAGSAVW